MSVIGKIFMLVSYMLTHFRSFPVALFALGKGCMRFPFPEWVREFVSQIPLSTVRPLSFEHHLRVLPSSVLAVLTEDPNESISGTSRPVAPSLAL